MKLTKIEIQNYKTIKRLNVDFHNDITLIVGKNNIGKSNVLKAIEIFFEWIEKGRSSSLLDYNDFRKNSAQLILSVTFGEVDKLTLNLKKSLIEEASKKRPNQENIKRYEVLYRTFQLIENRFHEFCCKLTIQRSLDDKASIEIIKSDSNSRQRKFENLLKKRHYAEKYFQDEFKIKQQSDSEWFEYDWLKIIKKEDGKTYVKLDDKEVDVTEEKVNELTDSTINKHLLDYIKDTQKFFYVPAYRGGKSERDEAINRLFDIIIEDLVKSKKGTSKDYDTVTDAIWGTGRNTNIYNLHSVIESRLKSLTESLKSDSISSIKEIEFQPFSKEEIRKKVLKILLGNTSIFLNDGVKTSFESKGTGIQSSFMITLMKSLSKIEFEENVNIILVIEEPEAFAHPQLIREIIDKIGNEFSKGLFQFIITTHSPVIVNFVNSNKVQRLKLNSSNNETVNVTNRNNLKLLDEDWNLINRVGDVNLSEIVFSDLVIFVEGEGDKIVFEKLLKIVLPDFYSKISIISLSGNNQIFKLLKLLQYYDINWMMIFDKDSFVNKSDKDLDISTDVELENFFRDYQIGEEFKVNFRSVLRNPNVSKIKIAVPSTAKIGDTLNKVNDVYTGDGEINEIRQQLYSIAVKKLDEDVFPELDAIHITKELNDKLEELNIPFYSLVSDLEGFVINDKTISTAESIYEKYFEQSYIDFKRNNQNASPPEFLKALRKSFGSKTHLLERAPRDRKKPHIPIEIITNFIDELESKNENSLSQEILDSFKELEPLITIVKRKLEIE